VSTPIILRRIHDLGGLTHNELRQAFERELKRLRPKRKSSGGDFYRTQMHVCMLGRDGCDHHGEGDEGAS
jgi:hypothetical protein